MRMVRIILATLFCGLLPCAVLAAAQQPDHHLLATTDLAREIHALQGPRSDMPTDSEALKRRVSLMRVHVQKFIVSQIKTYPSISGCELQKQLATAFGVEKNECVRLQEDEPGAPRVFVEPWGSNSTRRLFAVTYGWFGFYGKDGSQTILESYLWERDGSVHLSSGLMPASFSGFLTNSEDVCWFPKPDSYWVLVWGTVGGGSGRVIGGSASVFEIGVNRIRVVWNAPPNIGNLTAYALRVSRRWEIEYDDVNRTYSDLPNHSFLDIYSVDGIEQTFRRLVHIARDGR